MFRQGTFVCQALKARKKDHIHNLLSIPKTVYSTLTYDKLSQLQMWTSLIYSKQLQFSYINSIQPCGPTACRDRHWGQVRYQLGGDLGVLPLASQTGCRVVTLQQRSSQSYSAEVGLTSTHGTGSRTKLLERGWTLSFSGVAQGERHHAGVGILTSPWLSSAVLEFSPRMRGSPLCCCESLGGNL